VVADPPFRSFFAQAIDEEQDKDAGLGADELYGLYTSWCLLGQQAPKSPGALWEALMAFGIDPGNNHVGMRGPAAADYIIASAPDLV
jgi:hypothetical protein